MRLIMDRAVLFGSSIACRGFVIMKAGIICGNFLM